MWTADLMSYGHVLDKVGTMKQGFWCFEDCFYNMYMLSTLHSIWRSWSKPLEG